MMPVDDYTACGACINSTVTKKIILLVCYTFKKKCWQYAMYWFGQVVSSSGYSFAKKSNDFKLKILIKI